MMNGLFRSLVKYSLLILLFVYGHSIQAQSLLELNKLVESESYKEADVMFSALYETHKTDSTFVNQYIDNSLKLYDFKKAQSTFLGWLSTTGQRDVPSIGKRIVRAKKLYLRDTGLDLIDEQEIFKVVQEKPRFPGCENMEGSANEKLDCANELLIKYVKDHLVYPAIAKENKTEGTVVIRFIIDRFGNIRRPQIVKDLKDGCGEAAMQLVESMKSISEKWSPGKQRGRPVCVYVMLPIEF